MAVYNCHIDWVGVSAPHDDALRSAELLEERPAHAHRSRRLHGTAGGVVKQRSLVFPCRVVHKVLIRRVRALDDGQKKGLHWGFAGGGWHVRKLEVIELLQLALCTTEGQRSATHGQHKRLGCAVMRCTKGTVMR